MFFEQHEKLFKSTEKMICADKTEEVKQKLDKIAPILLQKGDSSHNRKLSLFQLMLVNNNIPLAQQALAIAYDAIKPETSKNILLDQEQFITDVRNQATELSNNEASQETTTLLFKTGVSKFLEKSVLEHINFGRSNNPYEESACCVVCNQECTIV